MIIIGLTGNIGMGKSTVAKMMGGLGAAHIDADKVGHEILYSDQHVSDTVLAAFGSSIAGADGHIDRQKLGGVVFADPAARERLNRITHPAIKAEIIRRLEAFKRQKVKVVVLEAALFFEAGWESLADLIWVVSASAENVIRRAKTYRGMSEIEILSRLQSQASIDEKKKKADEVIDTDCSIEEAAVRVKAAWDRSVAPLIG